MNEEYRTTTSSRDSAEVIVDLLISLWRSRRMLDASDNDRQVRDYIDRCFERVEKDGYTIEDRTGCFYDVGMVLKVVGAVPQPGLTQDIIAETVAPTIKRHGVILKVGEVVVGRGEPSR